MSDVKWIKSFIFAVLLALAVCIVFNIATDPFGVFGDPIFDWYSYNETNNPRVAKIAYLEEHHAEYDSYIIGSSSAASYSTEELNEYLDARFYNLFVYGCDTEDYVDFAAHVLDRYEVKNIVLNFGINEAADMGESNDGPNDRMHVLSQGGSKAIFYLKYALGNPRYGFDKIAAKLNDTYLPQVFDVFDVPSGCYDKRVRDVEKIGDRHAYDALYGADFAAGDASGGLTRISECAGAVAAIRDMCKKKDVRLIVIASPVYIGQWQAHSKSELLAYRKALADEVDFWDFSLTPISYDSRYFYDDTHFRNAVGSMVLAEIFGNDEVWRPQRFGTLITSDNCIDVSEALFSNPPLAEEDRYTADIPVLLYHHIDDEKADDTVVSSTVFEQQMKALSNAGYNAVTMQQLTDYVYHGAELPPSPVCITFDDGYLSNYETAYPILKELELKATVFAIGSSIGHKEFYKETEFAITPHFDYSEASEMLNSGVIDVQSHTYDMHQWEPYESEAFVRSTVSPLDGESEASYAAALRADIERFSAEIDENLSHRITALAYPRGEYELLTEVVVHESGIPITFSTKTDRRNILIKGLPQSLYALCRMSVRNDTSPEELLAYLNGKH